MKRIVPPLWVFVSVMLMTALHFFLPVWIVVLAPFNYGGAALIVLGVSLVGWPALMFRRAKTPIRPFRESTSLITSGPYRVSRNPIYLGMVLFLIGVALVLGSLTPMFVVPVFALMIDRVFIRGEQQMLHETFGDEYARYCLRVRRWI